MASEFSIRLGTPDDAEVIAGFNVAMAKETEDLELDLATTSAGVAALLSDITLGSYFLIETKDRVVAQLMITYEWSDWRNSQMWWIQSVYVHPDFRKQGLFRLLYNHVKMEAMNSGAGGIRLYVDSTNTKAQATYKAMGMVSHYAVFEEEFQR